MNPDFLQGLDDINLNKGVDIEQSKQLELMVINHRNQARAWFIGKYYEIIMNLRSYYNLPTTVNQRRMEEFLRWGYDVALGLDKFKRFVILGYISNNQTISNPANTWGFYPRLRGSDINWVIDESMRPEDPKELTDLHKDGNFIVVRNKPISFTSDIQMLKLWGDKYAEAEASYFSMIIQAKTNTFIQTDAGVGDETANQIATAVYNARPTVKVSKFVHPERDIIPMSLGTRGDDLKTMREIQQNIFNELNTQFGIDAAGITKESGTSDAEVHSNDDSVMAVALTYTRGIQEPFDWWNAAYDKNYAVAINKYQGVRSDNENDDNSNGNRD